MIYGDLKIQLMRRINQALSLFILLPVLYSCQPVKQISGNPCISNSTSSTQRLIDNSACALKTFRSETDAEIVNELLSRAKGVFIFPEQYKAAFMVGINGGTGVLCVRDDTGFWNGPAFYSLSGVDLGLQGGFSGSTVLVFLFDEESLQDVYSGVFNLSIGADIVLGKVHDKSFHDTMSATDSALTLVSSKGVLISMAYSGGVFSPRHRLNLEYYGKDIPVRDILSSHKYNKPNADVLLYELLGL